MRIIHTSDLHIDSPLGAHLTSEKAAERRRELLYNFERLIDRAGEIGAQIIIIAGDLFDSECITKRAKDTVLAAVERARGKVFLYLPGNHERDALLSESLPSNLHVFGKDWTYFENGEFFFAGRSECAADMFKTLKLSGEKKNIVVLHGEEAARSDENGRIGINEIEGLNIDYLALGHYHRYSKRVLGGCSIVYSGTPEGRGFDELGEKGFSLIEYKDGVMRDGFVKFAKRRLHDLKTDISTAVSTSELADAVERALSGIPFDDIVRLTLVGRCSPTLTKNTDGLIRRFSDAFYYFDLRDESRAAIDLERYRHDKSLVGEFIRLVSADGSLSEEEKEKIISTGLYALEGDIREEAPI